MAFEKLQAMGKEKFQFVVNELMRGTAALTLARKIQQEWGEQTHVGEKTLGMQLLRLKDKAAQGMFGAEKAKEIAKVEGPVDIKMLGGSSLNVLSELIQLTRVQQERIERLWEKEKSMPVPINALSTMINDQRDLLLDIQKVQFDLGVDEFHGVAPGVKLTSRTMTRPDGTTAHEDTMEAIGVAQSVFERRRIPAQVGDGART